LDGAFGHPGPALVDVVSERQELIMPPKTTFTQAQGFGLFLMRAVLDGGARELIDLAKAKRIRICHLDLQVAF
jgi:pyruvate dehydrogenase (quinone)